MSGTERTGCASNARGRAGIEQLKRADRSQHHWKPQFAAKQIDRTLDFRDVAQHARPKRDLVECHAVATHRRLGLGGADDVVQRILVEDSARLNTELATA